VPAFTNSIVQFGTTTETTSHASSHSSSAAFSSTASTWLCPYVYLLTLCPQLERTCANVPFAEQPTALHLSLPATFQRAKLAGVGNWSYVAPSINLICALSTAHKTLPISLSICPYNMLCSVCFRFLYCKNIFKNISNLGNANVILPLTSRYCLSQC